MNKKNILKFLVLCYVVFSVIAINVSFAEDNDVKRDFNSEVMKHGYWGKATPIKNSIDVIELKSSVVLGQLFLVFGFMAVLAVFCFRQGGKKGQISWFILAGVVILVGVSFLIYMRSATTEKTTREDIEKLAKEGHDERAIRDYVLSCIEPVTLTGVEILRLQGGYINPPSGGKQFRFRDKVGMESVVHNGLEKDIALDGGYYDITYWLDEENPLVPSLEYMELELETYVEDHLLSCLNEFEVFKGWGYNITYDKPDVSAWFAENIVVDFDFKIEYNKEGKKGVIDKFVYTIPVNFAQIYAIAEQLVIDEIEYAFLEDHIRKLISLYAYGGGSKGNHDIPPVAFTDTNTNCNSVSWTTFEVEQMLRDILEKNVKEIKIADTNYDLPNAQSQAQRGAFESFVWKFFGKIPNIEIEFEFDPDWDMVFDISPKKGGMIRPHKTKGSSGPFVPMLCTFQYEYKYTLKVPIIVRIREANSHRIDPLRKVVSEHKGFEFIFPMKAHLCGNQLRICRPNPLTELLEDAHIMGKPLPQKTMFCDEDQRKSGLVTLNITDYETNEGINQTEVYYSCGGPLNNCFIGVTEDDGILQQKMPLCINGQLMVSKENYSSYMQELTLKDNKSGRKIDIKLDRIRDFNVSVRIIDMDLVLRRVYEPCNQSGVDPALLASTFAPMPTDDVMVMIEPLVGDRAVPPVTYPEVNSTKFSSGVYNISFMYMGNTTIKPSTVQTGEDEYTTISMDTDPDPDVHEDYKGIWMLGNYKFKWNASIDELKNKTDIVFKVPATYHSSRELSVLDIGSVMIEQNGTVFAQYKHDHDCDPETDTKRMRYYLTYDHLRNYLRPELS